MYREFARVSSLCNFLRAFGFEQELITSSNIRLAVPTYKKVALTQTFHMGNSGQGRFCQIFRLPSVATKALLNLI